MLALAFAPLLAGLALPVAAQDVAPAPAKLTVEEALEIAAKLRPTYARSQGWVDGRRYRAHDAFDPAAKDGQKGLVAIDAETGSRTPLFDPEQFEAALREIPSVAADDAKRWAHLSRQTFTAAHDGVLLNQNDDLFFWRVGEHEALRITSDPHEEVGEELAPNGKRVAYVREKNLWVADLGGHGAHGGGRELQLTTDGKDDLLYGRLDWLYQEEVYGRGNFGAFWWSPDSTRIAYLALDESPVPSYTIVDHRKTRPEVEEWRYPKAGDPNPKVRLGVVDAGGGGTRWMDLTRYAGQEFLIVRVGWTPDGRHVIAQVQDRVQTWLDLVECDPRSGQTRVLFRDQTGAWVEPTGAPFWNEDGSEFLWLSERDGFRHLYLYQRDGTLVRRLTEGEWEVDAVHGIDEQRRCAWFDADRDDVKGKQLYRVGLDGADLVRVTAGGGTHGVSPSPTFEFYIDDWSALNDPGRAAVYRADGAEVRELGRATKEPLAKYRLAEPEFRQVKTRDGFTMEALLLLPPDYDPAVRYPVLAHTYSGPHAPQVLDTFGGRNFLFHQMLAQDGYVIWVCDNRSASGKGLVSARGVYQNLGTQELQDLEDGVDWLVQQGIADPARIGIWGWSYGGYQTAFALTHSKKFKVGIAGAPVTDWRLYDSIYTERYMGLPQANPEGYDRSSVTRAAKDLHGDLLLIHGAIDENVHLQNSMQFAEALQRAGKSFRLMIYPGNRHGVTDPAQRNHLHQMIADFVREKL